MMPRLARVAVGLLAAICAFAASGARLQAQTEDIEKARSLLTAANLALRKADSGEARLSAIGRAIRAHEAALAALRTALRSLAAEEAAIAERIAAEESDLGALLSGLQSLTNAPASALLVYPDRPADAVRAGAALAEIRPVLQARAAKLQERMARLGSLKQQKALAEAEVRAALDSLGKLNAESERALAGRREPAGPTARRLQEEAEAAENAADLTALAERLGHSKNGPRLGFNSAKGRLPLPVVGEIVAEFGEPGPVGQPAGGWTVASPAYAQVIAPWDATVRYAGRLGPHGNVMVLEPETGYLILLTGLGRIDRQVGEVVLAGETLGDMGGALPDADGFLFEAASDGDLIGPKKLYLELRREGEAIDPAEWFRRQDR